VVSLVYEILLVLYTIFIAEKREVLVPISSGILELLKYISLIFVVNYPNKVLAAIVVTIAVIIGSYLAVLIAKYLAKSKVKKNDFSSSIR
jgi:uncharacterized membrane protein (DUF485 family)